MTSNQQQFTADVTDLPLAGPTEVVELSDGDRYELRIAPVTKQIGDATVRMLAYNGSIPGTRPCACVRAPSLRDDRERRRPGDHRALARAAAGQPVRRHPPHPGTHRDRGPLHVPDHLP